MPEFVGAVLLLVIGLFLGWVVWGLDEAEAEFRGACESRGGHVLYIDNDNKTCLRNGEVVKW